MKKLAKNWLGYAKRDLQAAQQLSPAEELTGITTFHCQQCIEKSLKALLEFHDKTIPRIHDLVTLHQQVNDVEALVVDEAVLRELADAYIDTRYPSSEMTAGRLSPSVAKAGEFLKLAEQTYQTISKRISEKLDAGERAQDIGNTFISGHR